MRTLCIFIIVLISSACRVSGQQAFSHVAIDNYHNHATISFTVAAGNAFQYRILAGNDSTALELLGTIQQVINNTVGATYHYDVYEPLYKYYQLAEVERSSAMKYSAIINTRYPQQSDPAPMRSTPKILSGHVLVKNQ